MWETFDRKRERGQGSRREEAEGRGRRSASITPPRPWREPFSPMRAAGPEGRSQSQLSCQACSQRGQAHSKTLQQVSKRETQSCGLEVLGRGWGRVPLKHRGPPFGELSCLRLLLLLSCRDTRPSTQPLPSSKWAINNYVSFHLSPVCCELQRIFFYWALALCTTNLYKLSVHQNIRWNIKLEYSIMQTKKIKFNMTIILGVTAIT